MTTLAQPTCWCFALKCTQQSRQVSGPVKHSYPAPCSSGLHITPMLQIPIYDRFAASYVELLRCIGNNQSQFFMATGFSILTYIFGLIPKINVWMNLIHRSCMVFLSTSCQKSRKAPNHWDGFSLHLQVESS